MSTTQEVIDLFAERLWSAEDKEAAADRILQRMSKMKHKGDSQPISFQQKKRLIELLGRKVIDQAKSTGTDSMPYLATINYMLQNIGGEENGQAT